MREMCVHRDPPKGKRRYGKQCRRTAKIHVWMKNSDQGGNFCIQHATLRASAGMVHRRLEDR